MARPTVVEDLRAILARARGLADRTSRSILGITGAPGGGKSTLAARCVQELGTGTAVLVPMDGFHLAEAELHRQGRHHRKGAPDTFDSWGYQHLLSRLRERSGGTVYAPQFHREVEESFAGSIAVPHDVPLVVTEGNYLLWDVDGWAGVRGLLDEVWFVEVDEALRLERLIRRHQSFGRDLAEARRRSLGSDQDNATAIAATRDLADVIVRVSAV